MRPARTDTFDHTISGLLTKRADLWNEAQVIRDRLAEIRNDLGAIDRTLNVLGYEGDLDAAMPRQKRHVVFGKGELFRACMDVLRHADRPMTSRQIAQEIVAQSGQDARDRRYVADLVKRVGKCLRQSQDCVRKSKDAKGNIVWVLSA